MSTFAELDEDEMQYFRNSGDPSYGDWAQPEPFDSIPTISNMNIQLGPGLRPAPSTNVPPNRAGVQSVAKKLPIKAGNRPTVSSPTSMSSPEIERDDFGRQIAQPKPTLMQTGQKKAMDEQSQPQQQKQPRTFVAMSAEEFAAAPAHREFGGGSTNYHNNNAGVSASRGASIPSLPVADTTRMQLLSAGSPNFSEVDEASPPRVPPGLTPTATDARTKSALMRLPVFDEEDNRSSSRSHRGFSEESALGIRAMVAASANNAGPSPPKAIPFSGGGGGAGARRVSFASSVSPPEKSNQPNFGFAFSPQSSDSSPPGMSIAAFFPAHANVNSNSNNYNARSQSVSDENNNHQKFSSPVAAAAIAAVSVSPMDRLRFGYAASNVPSAAPASESFSPLSFSPKESKQQPQKASHSRVEPPRQTALQLVQANMKLNKENDSEMRAFVSSLKDERGKPVATTQSQSPERNAFLRDLDELPPSSSAASASTLRNSTITSGTTPKRASGPSTTAAATLVIPSADLVDFIPDVSPATRALQRWQIDRTPQALPQGYNVQISLGSGTGSPVKIESSAAVVEKATKQDLYAAFPFLPKQDLAPITQEEFDEFLPDSPSKSKTSTSVSPVKVAHSAIVSGMNESPVQLRGLNAQQLQPHTPGARPLSGGASRPHSRLAQAYALERAKLRELREPSPDSPISLPSDVAPIGDGESQSAVVVDVVVDPVDVSETQVGWSTKKILVVFSVVIGITVIVVLAIVGLVVGI